MTSPTATNAPLTGVRIAVTRAGERGGPLAAALRKVGATVHELPLTRIESLDQAPLLAAVDALASYQWVLLTSVNAVDHLAATVTTALAAAQLRARKIAVVGSATADACAQRGWTPTLVPERFHAEALVDAMSSRTDIDGARMLYPAAQGARDVLPNGLRALGAVVDVIPVYRSVVDVDGQSRLRGLATSNGLDLVTVAAPSAVDALLDEIGRAHV